MTEIGIKWKMIKETDISKTNMMTNNERFPFNDIHETVVIYPGVIIGKGNVIGPYCIIGAPAEWRGNDHVKGSVIIGNDNHITGHCTIDSGAIGSTVILDRCYIMKGVHIGHNARIMSRVTLSCHSIIGGHSVIEQDVNIGLGAIIHQKKEIPEGCMIGMGAIVTKGLELKPYHTYVGNPAKLLGLNDKHPKYPEYTINMKDTL
jgi:UDP-N-acetylglucosamine acyltransferase